MRQGIWPENASGDCEVLLGKCARFYLVGNNDVVRITRAIMGHYSSGEHDLAARVIDDVIAPPFFLGNVYYFPARVARLDPHPLRPVLDRRLGERVRPTHVRAGNLILGPRLRRFRGEYIKRHPICIAEVDLRSGEPPRERVQNRVGEVNIVVTEHSERAV